MNNNEYHGGQKPVLGAAAGRRAGGGRGLGRGGVVWADPPPTRPIYMLNYVNMDVVIHEDDFLIKKLAMRYKFSSKFSGEGAGWLVSGPWCRLIPGMR